MVQKKSGRQQLAILWLKSICTHPDVKQKGKFNKKLIACIFVEHLTSENSFELFCQQTKQMTEVLLAGNKLKIYINGCNKENWQYAFWILEWYRGYLAYTRICYSMVQGKLSFRQIHLLFSNFLSVILHLLSRNCFTIKIKFFTSISKSVVTCITITVTNISNSIMKQFYGIRKLKENVVIAKKKQLNRTNILISDRSITLNKQAFFDFKNIRMMSIWQDGKFIKGRDIIAI